MQSYTETIMQRIIDQVAMLDHDQLTQVLEYLDRLECRPDRTVCAADTDPAAQKSER